MCELMRNGIGGEWYWNGMGSAWQGNSIGTAWAPHGMCELAFIHAIGIRSRKQFYPYSMTVLLLRKLKEFITHCELEAV
jgi:hypothetical protein